MHNITPIDLASLRRKAKQDAAQNRYYRAYIKEKLPLSNDALDTEVAALADDAFSRINCLSCGACCRRNQIAVTTKDIRRLARAVGATTEYFTRRYVAETSTGTTYVKGGPCPFLGDNNICSVYEDRPQACRDFPYLHEKKIRVRTLTMLENVGECPIVEDVWTKLKKKYPEPRPV